MAKTAQISWLVMALLAMSSAAGAAAGGGKKVTYQDDVYPLLRNSCLNCHNPDRKKAGLDLSSYAAAMAGSDDGKVVNSGDPEGSKLFLAVAHKEEPYMPKGGDKLSDRDVNLIRDWIAGGALDTSSSQALVADKAKVDLTILPGAMGKPAGPAAMPHGLSRDPIVYSQRSGPLLSLAASPWAPLVALGGQRQIVLYNTQTLERIGVLPFAEGIPAELKFSRSGALLLAAGGQGARLGKVILFDVATGRRVAEVGNEFDTVLAADITANQALVALGGPAKVLKAYRVKDNQLLWTVKKHTDWVTAVACSPDGILLASGDRAGNLYVWEAKNGQEFYTLAGHKDAITSLAFRADSNVLASASQDGSVRLWNMQDGSSLRNWNADAGGVMSLAFAHDGRLVTCGRDNAAHLWNPDGGQGRKFDGFSDIAVRAAVSADDARIIAGDWTGKVLVFNAADGKIAGELTANPAAATSPRINTTQTASGNSRAK